MSQQEEVELFKQFLSAEAAEIGIYTKDYILDKIKLTAKANKGVPLGQINFSKATGININAWRGKYWPRWNDAVKEAGLTPNKMNVAYDEKLLLHKFIALMRELGHFPLSTELDVKAHRDKNFKKRKQLNPFHDQSSLSKEEKQQIIRNAIFNLLRI
jgi:hypothetical protein